MFSRRCKKIKWPSNTKGNTMSLTRKLAHATVGVMASGALLTTSLVPAAAETSTDPADPVDAVESSTQASGDSPEMAASNEGITDEIINKYDDYVEQDQSGEYVLNLPSGFDGDPEEIEIVENSIAVSNNTDHSASAGDELEADDLLSSQNVSTSSAAAGGFSAHWWGVEIWLNGAAAAELQKALGGTSGVAGGAAALTALTGVGGVVAGTVAGVLSAGAGLATLCNWNGNGLTIRNHYSALTYCWPR